MNWEEPFEGYIYTRSNSMFLSLTKKHKDAEINSLTMLTHCTRVALALAFILALLHRAEGCHSSQIECRSGGHCMDREYICDGNANCPDGSDEDPSICKVWPTRNHGCYDNRRIINDRGNCRSVYYMCRNRPGNLEPNICEIALQPKLKRVIQTGMNMSSDVVALLSSAVNSTLSYKMPDCPMLYTRVGEDCLSLFSPAKVSWAEARQFCISIYGDLWHAKNLTMYGHLMEYMREKKLTSDYWIGGRYDIDTNAWSWVTDDSAMPLGAPFWRIRHESSCVARAPPHTDPYSPSPAALPGAPCYKAVLSPKERSAGWCSALTYEYFYYWSDERCNEAFSPLCTFTGPAAPHQPPQGH